jgi:hypothetical protein
MIVSANATGEDRKTLAKVHGNSATLAPEYGDLIADAPMLRQGFE